MTSIPEASSVLSTYNVVEVVDFSAGPDNLEMCLECDFKKVMLVREYLFHIKTLNQSNYRISLNRPRAGYFFQAQDSVASYSRARVKQGRALYTSELPPRPA